MLVRRYPSMTRIFVPLFPLELVLRLLHWVKSAQRCVLIPVEALLDVLHWLKQLERCVIWFGQLERPPFLIQPRRRKLLFT